MAGTEAKGMGHRSQLATAVDPDNIWDCPAYLHDASRKGVSASDGFVLGFQHRIAYAMRMREASERATDTALAFQGFSLLC